MSATKAVLGFGGMYASVMAFLGSIALLIGITLSSVALSFFGFNMPLYLFGMSGIIGVAVAVIAAYVFVKSVELTLDNVDAVGLRALGLLGAYIALVSFVMMALTLAAAPITFGISLILFGGFILTAVIGVSMVDYGFELHVLPTWLQLVDKILDISREALP